MRGFLLGSLALIVFGAVIKDRAAERLAAGNDSIAASLSRFLSPAVAGVPERTTRTGRAGRFAGPRTGTSGFGSAPSRSGAGGSQQSVF